MRVAVEPDRRARHQHARPVLGRRTRTSDRVGANAARVEHLRFLRVGPAFLGHAFAREVDYRVDAVEGVSRDRARGRVPRDLVGGRGAPHHTHDVVSVAGQ